MNPASPDFWAGILIGILTGAAGSYLAHRFIDKRRGTTSMSEISVATDSPTVSRVVSSDVESQGGDVVETGHGAVTQFIAIAGPATLYVLVLGALFLTRRRH